jgi:hypothetical protein
MGVYPSALHVRWTSPEGISVGALAVDDEPEVFWDGADAADRITHWKEAVGWRREWGRVGGTAGNGSSGRRVRADVLEPLSVAAAATFFTDCLPCYFVKRGPGSQGDRIDEVYRPFAGRVGIAAPDIPTHPREAELVKRSIRDEGADLVNQLSSSGAGRIVTLGQESADVLATLGGVERRALRPDAEYGSPRTIQIEGESFDWLPLTHPGNQSPVWRTRHQAWMASHIDAG